MNMTTSKTLIALLAALPALAVAGSIEIPRNTVIEVVSDQDLSIKRAHEGDRFSVTVTGERDLPRGSKLQGEILRIEPKRGDKPAYMDLEFNALLLPDGSRQRIEALPISLDNKNIERGRDGRMVANSKKVKSEYYVGGGLIGGLIVGALVKKPFEGAFIGTLAGIILSESEKQKNNQDLVLRKGSKLGALLLQDLSVDNRDQFNRDDRYRDQDRNRDRDNGRGGFDLRYDDRALAFEGGATPYMSGQTIMVPLNSTARQLRLQVDRTDERIFIENDTHVMKLYVGEKAFRLDGARRGDLTASVEERNGEIFVPLEAFAPLVERPLYANGTEVKLPA